MKEWDDFRSSHSYLSLCRRYMVRHALNIRILAVDWLDAWKVRRLDEVVFLCLHLKLKSLEHELLDECLDFMSIVSAEWLI